MTDTFNQITDRSTTGNTTPATILSANANRKFLMVSNSSSVMFGFSISGVTPSVSVAGVGGAGTVVLAPGGGIVLDQKLVPSNALQGVWASGTNNPVTIWEV